MKLKYFLQKYSLDFYLHPNIIKAVEEWLKQKQHRKNNPTCGCPDHLVMTIENRFIDKLLKEVKEK